MHLKVFLNFRFEISHHSSRGDAVYFHCQSNTTKPIQWYFLSFNYYLMKTLPVIYEYDMKIKSVEIADAGMYTCQTENTIHQRIILTIIRKIIIDS